MMRILLLSIFLGALAITSVDGHPDCESYCRCNQCQDCKDQQQNPPYTEEQCCKYCNASTTECESECACTEQYSCVPKCNCSAYCECINCRACEKEGLPPLPSKEQCDKYCEIAPSSKCSNECICPLAISCGPKQPPCDCDATCKCNECKQCESIGQYPPYSKETCCKYCNATSSECDKKCFCIADITCIPPPCDCDAQCKCNECKQCKNIGQYPPYSEKECNQYCNSSSSECDSECFCAADISCIPSPCDCDAQCKCNECNQCKNIGQYPPYTDEECDKYCNSTLPECDSECFCTADISCSSSTPSTPEPCDCGAYCNCTNCQQCKNQSLPLPYSEEQCDKFCDIAPPSKCGSQCVCTLQLSCGHPCNCDAYCKGIKCKQCKDLGKSPLYSDKECDQFCEEAPPSQCGSQCACTDEITCKPDNTTCNCSAVCINSYCTNCTTQTKYSASDCKNASTNSNNPDCKAKNCTCPLMPTCPPECCPGKCYGSFCETCPQQKTFPPETCANYIKQYKSPACKNIPCPRPQVFPVCPKKDCGSYS